MFEFILIFLVFDVLVLLYFYKTRKTAVEADIKKILEKLDELTRKGNFNDASIYAYDQAKLFEKNKDEFRTIFFLARASYFGAIAGNIKLIRSSRLEMRKKMEKYVSTILKNNKIKDEHVLIEKLGKIGKSDKKMKNVLKLWLMTIIADMTYMYLYTELDDFDNSIKLGNQLIEYGDTSDKIKYLSIAARCFAKLDNIDKAIEYSKRSINIGRSKKDPSLYIPDLINLGNYYAYAGKTDLAIDTWREAARIAKRNNLIYNIIMAEGNIANVYTTSGQFDEAEKLIKNEIFPFVKKAQILDSYIDTLCLLSDIEYIKNNISKSVDYLYEARKIMFEKSIKNRATAIYSRLVSRLVAYEKFEEAQEIFNEYYTLTKNPEQNSYILSLRALLIMKTNMKEAFDIIDKAIHLAEREKNIHPMIFAYNVKIRLLIKNNAYDSTIDVLLRAEELAKQSKNKVMELEIGIVKTLIYALQGEIKRSQELMNNIYDLANKHHLKRILNLINKIQPVLETYTKAYSGYSKVKDATTQKKIHDEDLLTYIELITRRVQA